MRIGWLAAADEARLLGDRARVLAITIPPRRGNCGHGLVVSGGLVAVGTTARPAMGASGGTSLTEGIGAPASTNAGTKTKSFRPGRLGNVASAPTPANPGSHARLPEMKGGVCVSTVSIVCGRDGGLPRSSAGRPDPGNSCHCRHHRPVPDAADGFADGRARRMHPDDPASGAAFTTEDNSNVQARRKSARRRQPASFWARSTKATRRTTIFARKRPLPIECCPQRARNAPWLRRYGVTLRV
jgi:hypothetical protein